VPAATARFAAAAALAVRETHAPMTVLAVTAVLALAACGGPEPIPVDPARYAPEVEAWHERRVSELEAPDSWLSLVGLAWLDEGASTMGSDSTNDIVLPAQAAPRVGRVIVSNSVVRFVAEPGVVVTRGVDSTMVLAEGSWLVPRDRTTEPRVDEATLGQVAPGHYTVLRNGPVDWLLLRRGDRWALRIRSDSAPAYARFHGIDRFPVSLDWRVTARFEARPDTVAVPDALGGVSRQPSPGALVFELGAERRRLVLTGRPEDGRYMIVFGDRTNGTETYGGGRFLWVDEPDGRGRVVVDFNYAYNPPCVYSPYATCPLPPRENRLALRVEAGEKAPPHTF